MGTLTEFKDVLKNAIIKLAGDNKIEREDAYIVICSKNDLATPELKLYNSTEFFKYIEISDIIGENGFAQEMVYTKLKEYLKNSAKENNLNLTEVSYLICYNGDIQLHMYLNNKHYKHLSISNILI